ncbi:MAG: tetratricopeptide repeat protein [Myxococcota bacterium]
MGLLSWLFPTPEDRVARARRFFEQNRPDEARLELLGVDHPDAQELLARAHRELAVANLDAAVSWARAGDDDRVRIHLELADQFHEGGLEERFREARREMREMREARRAVEADAQREAQARLFDLDVPEQFDDGTAGLLPHADDPEREEVEQRIALLIENYPDALEGTVRDLGPEFITAVLELENGNPQDALMGLLDLPDKQPLVQWERARAAHALGDASSAATALRAFAKFAKGHHRIGNTHSGTYLAQLLAESGELDEALRVLRDVRRKAPQEGGALFAQLLMVTGELEKAETVTKDLLKKSPKAMPLYGLLARIRLAGDHRVEAMRALEAGLEATHCPPGKCGYQPPDLDAHRLLATLYLEDGIETQRALELSATAASLVNRPSWDDIYLRALVAKATQEPDAMALAERLLQSTPEDDPRRPKVLALTSAS